MKTNFTHDHRTLRLSVAAAILAVMAACGSGGGYDDGGGVDNGAIPVATIDEFTTWAKTREPTDTGEPIDVESLQPPTSDVAEASDLD